MLPTFIKHSITFETARRQICIISLLAFLTTSTSSALRAYKDVFRYTELFIAQLPVEITSFSRYIYTHTYMNTYLIYTNVQLCLRI